MKRVRGGFGLVGLLVVAVLIIAFLPSIRSMFMRSFPEGFQSRKVDCAGVVCPEGQFCQDSQCHNIEAPKTNEV